MLTKSRATIDDLYRVKGKAELVDGEIVYMAPTGDGPARAGGKWWSWRGLARSWKNRQLAVRT